MKQLLTALLLACSLTLIGCGGSDSPGEAVKELAYAMEAGDAEKLKELMPELEENLGDSKIDTIAKQMAKEAKENGGIESVTIDKEEINGDTATVTATMTSGNGDSEQEEFELVKNKDGKWVVSMGEDIKPSGGGGPSINLNGGDFEEIEDIEEAPAE